MPKRLVAFFLFFVFILNQVYGVPTAGAQIVFDSEIPIKIPFSLTLPAELGKIEHLISSDQKPVLIHIQESHGNLQGEKSIQAILHYLRKEYGVKLLLLEGSAVPLEKERLKIVGDTELNQKVLNHLLEKGLATGPELYLAESEDAQAYGIENLKSYVADGKAFHAVLSQKEKVHKWLGQRQVELEKLENKYLSKGLREHLYKQNQFKSQILDFSEWLNWIKKQAQQKLKVNLTHPSTQLDWPLLSRIFIVRKLEAKIDSKAIEQEKQKFLKATKPYLTKDARGQVESLVPGTFSSAFTRESAEALVSALPINFDFSAYLNFNRSVGIQILQNEIDSADLMQEIERLNQQIIQKLIRSDKEREIVDQLEEFNLLQKAFNLELTEKEYEQLLKVPGTIQLRDVLKFYELAKIRDQYMLQHIEAIMRKTGEQRAVVITGGFHAGPFQQYFRNKKYNYALITPKIEISKSDSRYRENMLQFMQNPAVSNYREVPYLASSISTLNAHGRNGQAIQARIQAEIQIVTEGAAGHQNEKEDLVAGTFGSQRSELRVPVKAKKLSFEVHPHAVGLRLLESQERIMADSIEVSPPQAAIIRYPGETMTEFLKDIIGSHWPKLIGTENPTIFFIYREKGEGENQIAIPIGLAIPFEQPISFEGRTFEYLRIPFSSGGRVVRESDWENIFLALAKDGQRVQGFQKEWSERFKSLDKGIRFPPVGYQLSEEMNSNQDNSIQFEYLPRFSIEQHPDHVRVEWTGIFNFGLYEEAWLNRIRPAPLFFSLGSRLFRQIRLAGDDRSAIFERIPGVRENSEEEVDERSYATLMTFVAEINRFLDSYQPDDASDLEIFPWQDFFVTVDFFRYATVVHFDHPSAGVFHFSIKYPDGEERNPYQADIQRFNEDDDKSQTLRHNSAQGQLAYDLARLTFALIKNQNSEEFSVSPWKDFLRQSYHWVHEMTPDLYISEKDLARRIEAAFANEVDDVNGAKESIEHIIKAIGLLNDENWTEDDSILYILQALSHINQHLLTANQIGELTDLLANDVRLLHLGLHVADIRIAIDSEYFDSGEDDENSGGLAGSRSELRIAQIYTDGILALLTDRKVTVDFLRQNDLWNKPETKTEKEAVDFLAVLQNHAQILAPHIRVNDLENKVAIHSLFETAVWLVQTNQKQAQHVVLVADTVEEAKILKEMFEESLMVPGTAGTGSGNLSRNVPGTIRSRIHIVALEQVSTERIVPPSAKTIWVDWNTSSQDMETVLANHVITGEVIDIHKMENPYGAALLQAVKLLLEGPESSNLQKSKQGPYMQQSLEGLARFITVLQALQRFSTSA